MISRIDHLHHLLSSELSPEYLFIEDESHQHAKPGIETHIKITAVSAKFDTRRRIERHQMIYQLVDAEFKTGLHALSLHLFTPSEWVKNPEAPKTPACQRVRASRDTLL